MPQSQQDCAIRLQQCAVHKAARLSGVGGATEEISARGGGKGRQLTQCFHISRLTHKHSVYILGQ